MSALPYAWISLFNARRRYSSRRGHGPPCQHARCSFQNCMFRAREVIWGLCNKCQCHQALWKGAEKAIWGEPEPAVVDVTCSRLPISIGAGTAPSQRQQQVNLAHRLPVGVLVSLQTTAHTPVTGANCARDELLPPVRRCHARCRSCTPPGFTCRPREMRLHSHGAKRSSHWADAPHLLSGSTVQHTHHMGVRFRRGV